MQRLYVFNGGSMIHTAQEDTAQEDTAQDTGRGNDSINLTTRHALLCVMMWRVAMDGGWPTGR